MRVSMCIWRCNNYRYYVRNFVLRRRCRWRGKTPFVRNGQEILLHQYKTHGIMKQRDRCRLTRGPPTPLCSLSYRWLDTWYSRERLIFVPLFDPVSLRENFLDQISTIIPSRRFHTSGGISLFLNPTTVWRTSVWSHVEDNSYIVL